MWKKNREIRMKLNRKRFGGGASWGQKLIIVVTAFTRVMNIVACHIIDGDVD